MRMTRHPARSFTFEIKRANRRMPEVVTLSKTSSPGSSSLADQVFGKLSVQSRASQPSQINVPASVRPAPSLGTNSPDVSCTSEPSAERSARRVLPDLLSIPIDPVEERVQREAEERIDRRRAARVSRAKKVVERSSVAAACDDAATTPVPTAEDTVREPAVANTQPPEAPVSPQKTVHPVQQIATPRKRKWNTLVAALKKAERSGRPVPRLPAGQRWKRRLPHACW
jgi:hypothetical protein